MFCYITPHYIGLQYNAKRKRVSLFGNTGCLTLVHVNACDMYTHYHMYWSRNGIGRVRLALIARIWHRW